MSTKSNTASVTVPFPPAPSFERFTKTLAKKLLETPGKNRTVRLPEVKRYKEDMNAGLWRDTDRASAPILIDKDGVLRGGQHRMHAFVKSDLNEIIFLVVRDATEEEIANQDAAISRTYRDQVVMFQDIPSFLKIKANKVISACRLLGEVTSGKKYTPAQTAEIALNFNKNLEDADGLISKDGRMLRYSGVLAAFLWAKNHMSPKSWEEAFEQFDQGTNILPGSAIHRLRNLTDSKEAGRRQGDLFLKTLCALKSVHEGKSVNLTASEKHLEDW